MFHYSNFSARVHRCGNPSPKFQLFSNGRYHMSRNSEHECSIHNPFNRNSSSTRKAWKSVQTSTLKGGPAIRPFESEREKWEYSQRRRRRLRHISYFQCLRLSLWDPSFIMTSWNSYMDLWAWCLTLRVLTKVWEFTVVFTDETGQSQVGRLV